MRGKIKYFLCWNTQQTSKTQFFLVENYSVKIKTTIESSNNSCSLFFFLISNQKSNKKYVYCFRYKVFFSFSMFLEHKNKRLRNFFFIFIGNKTLQLFFVCICNFTNIFLLKLLQKHIVRKNSIFFW